MRLKVPTQSIHFEPYPPQCFIWSERELREYKVIPQKLFSLTAPQIFRISSARVCNVCKMLHIYLMVKIGHIMSQKATGETALLYSNHWKTWPAFGMNCPDAKFSFSFLSETGSLLYLKRMRPWMNGKLSYTPNHW